MKKNIVILLMALILIPTQISFAADKDVGTNIKACLVTYTTAMPAFLQTVVSAEGFVENFTAYFVDLVSRSACQLSEILTLDTQLDAITKQMQKAYLECKLSKIEPLKAKYIRAKAEIYYVRHIVNMSGKLEDVVGDTSDLTVEDIEDDPEVDAEMFVDLYDKMEGIYASRLPEGEDFDKMFKEIEVKFKTYKYEFLLCGEWQVWQKVADKWKEFIGNWGGTKDAINNTADKIVNESSNLKKSAEEMKLRYTKNSSNKPAGAFKNFLQNTFQTSINKVDPASGVAEIFDEADKYLVGDQYMNLGSLYTAISNEEERYEFDVSRTTIQAQYMALYAGTTDAAVQSFTDNLDILLETVKSTAIPIGSLNSCASKVLSKQCK